MRSWLDLLELLRTVIGVGKLGSGRPERMPSGGIGPYLERPCRFAVGDRLPSRDAPVRLYDLKQDRGSENPGVASRIKGSSHPASATRMDPPNADDAVAERRNVEIIGAEK